MEVLNSSQLVGWLILVSIVFIFIRWIVIHIRNYRTHNYIVIKKQTLSEFVKSSEMPWLSLGSLKPATSGEEINEVKVEPEYLTGRDDSVDKTMQTFYPLNEWRSSKLKTTSEIKDDIIILRLEGFVDKDTIQTIQQIFEFFLDRGFIKVIIDLKKVKDVDSFGLTMLIMFFKQVRGAGGDLILAEMLPAVFQMLNLLKLHDVFRHYATVEEAVAQFKSTEQFP